MTKSIIVENHQVDAIGDMILPGAFTNIPKMVPITHNFKSSEVLGLAKVHENDGRIVADIPVELAENHPTLYPAVGFSIQKWHQENEVRMIDECKLHTVGLCESPNLDSSIKSIGEQS